MRKILLLANKLVGGPIEGITKSLLISPQSRALESEGFVPSCVGTVESCGERWWLLKEAWQNEGVITLPSVPTLPYGR